MVHAYAPSLSRSRRSSIMGNEHPCCAHNSSLRRPCTQACLTASNYHEPSICLSTTHKYHVFQVLNAACDHICTRNVTTKRLQWNLSKTTAQGTFKTRSPLPRGLFIRRHLTGISIPWCWFQWSSSTGGRLIQVVALTDFTLLVVSGP